MSAADAVPPPEFSRPIAVEKLIAGGSLYRIEAKPAEREALARRFGILGVDALTAELTLRSGAKGTVRVEGEFRADVRQACVVTLVEVPAHIEGRFTRAYAPETDREEPEITLDLEAEDPPDPLTDGIVDIGEAVAEELALALDPYPRAPGAVFELPQPEEPTTPTPFAALAAFKRPR
jgi:uncharacterized metal-binding protein YceD (DUF177 family)